MRRLALLALLLLLPIGGASAGGVRGPVSLAVGSDSVWVGFGDGRIARVDPATRRVSTIVRPSMAGFVGSMASGFGSVWAARHDRAVVRINASTGRVMATLTGAWSPNSVAIGQGFLWVGEYERDLVYRVDPATNRVTGRRRVPGRLWGAVAAGQAGVWLQTIPAAGPAEGPAGPRVLWRLDPRTLRLTRVMEARCDSEMAVASTVWLLNTCDGSVFRPRSQPIRVAANGVDIALGAGSVWVVGNRAIRRVDPERRKVVAEVAADGEFLAVSRDSVWVLDMGDGVTGWLRRIDPKTNTILDRPIRLASR